MNVMDVMNDLPVLAASLDASDRQYIYAVVRRIVRSEDAASDVTQDTLLLAHRHRDQFRGDSAHRTWLYRIAVTTALGYLRRQRRSREELASGVRELGGDMPDPHPSPEEVVSARELEARVDACLGTIDPKHRDVFVMRASEVPEAEIAQALGISVANVKIRAHRVRTRLRAQLLAFAVDRGATPAGSAADGQRGVIDRGATATVTQARPAPLGRLDSPADSSSTIPAS